MYEPNDYIKTCPGCNTAYEANRLNQTFCTPKCKNRYHNNIQRAERMRRAEIQKITKDTNSVLWRNRELLKEFAGREMEMQEMKEHGFTFNFVTQFQLADDGGNILYCYDYRYIFTDYETIIIIEND